VIVDGRLGHERWNIHIKTVNVSLALKFASVKGLERSCKNLLRLLNFFLLKLNDLVLYLIANWTLGRNLNVVHHLL